MKYETLLGRPEKFIGHKEDAEILLWHDFLGPKPITFDEAKSMVDRGETPAGSVVVAMRRIIAEPKRWTWEDKKAGRLPEVGNYLLIEGNIAEFIGLSHAPNNWCFRRLNGEWGIQTANKDWFSPIETPEEKAARLREEWCSDALGSASILSGMKEYELKRLGGYVGNIYDALLSGELPVPSAPEQVKDGE